MRVVDNPQVRRTWLDPQVRERARSQILNAHSKAELYAMTPIDESKYQTWLSDVARLKDRLSKTRDVPTAELLWEKFGEGIWEGLCRSDDEIIEMRIDQARIAKEYGLGKGKVGIPAGQAFNLLRGGGKTDEALDVASEFKDYLEKKDAEEAERLKGQRIIEQIAGYMRK